MVAEVRNAGIVGLFLTGPRPAIDAISYIGNDNVAYVRDFRAALSYMRHCVFSHNDQIVLPVTSTIIIIRVLSVIIIEHHVHVYKIHTRMLIMSDGMPVHAVLVFYAHTSPSKPPTTLCLGIFALL